MKHAAGFIQNILRAMPFFQEAFRNHSERILKIMLDVQGGTRKLQALCAHGKSMLDGSAAAHVPKVKYNDTSHTHYLFQQQFNDINMI